MCVIGGGAGGSIWINCDVMHGEGLLSAVGGDGEGRTAARGGGGGGGHISVNCADLDKFNVTMRAHGGTRRNFPGRSRHARNITAD